MGLVRVNPDKCVGCNACIRSCPSPEANHTSINPENGRSVTVVNERKCISCGECIRVCQRGARTYDDDLAAYMKALEEHERTVLIVTPAFKAAFPGTWQHILDWFRNQGVIGIYDASYGADICTWTHMEYLVNVGKEVKMITQPCAAIVNYCQIYRPELLDKLSPVHSPVCCEAIYLKKYLKITNRIAALTPCIAEKTEFEETDLVDYNVTFKKLQHYFKKNGIKFNEEKFSFFYDFDGDQGTLGSIYSRPGGLRDNIWFKDPDMNITTSAGVQKVYGDLDLYSEASDDKRPDIYDVLSCVNGCNMGPASGVSCSPFDVMSTMREIERAGKEQRGAARGIFGDKDRVFKYYSLNFNYKHFLRVYEAPRHVTPVPKDSELENIFLSMGKVNAPDRRYNCHACGYKTCKDMAIAIYRGLNTPENCAVYSKSALTSRYLEAEKISAGVGQFATKLTADIENIYASLLSIDDKNQQAQTYVTTVNNILQSIIETCNSADSFNADDIAALADTLGKMTGALNVLNQSSVESSGNSASIREAMEEVANATMELSRMVDELVNSFEGKY